MQSHVLEPSMEADGSNYLSTCVQPPIYVHICISTTPYPFLIGTESSRHGPIRITGEPAAETAVLGEQVAETGVTTFASAKFSGATSASPVFPSPSLLG
eukprot:14112416-Ditylum_brightwellii.AAC.1